MSNLTSRPVHFIGHSMGGMLLATVASMKRTIHLRSGVVIGGSIYMDDSKWKSMMFAWPMIKCLGTVHANYFQCAVSPFSFRFNSFWDKLFFCTDNVDPEAARKLFCKNWGAIPASLLNQLRSGFGVEGLKSHDGCVTYADHLSSVEIPVLAIAGTVDRQVSSNSVKKMASQIPGSKFMCMGKDYGHEQDYGETQFFC